MKILLGLIKATLFLGVGGIAGYKFAKFEDEVGTTKAFSQYLMEAESGVAASQYQVSRYLFHRNQKPQESLKWLKKAAQNGYLRAKIELASHYEEGGLVSKDEVMALKLYQEIAETSIQRLKKIN
ncbi:SEL1-like repeat protein [Candidatus Odyssella thessalonicensis]|uniref:SEL1-like repeat protein n=1 Tax=Candidatus Odyssella thessalonicensis TaxID=84647 RepID=UPI001585085C|nr:SEL1-like repeat protein [Candidatus Odyssella thessalonicensis]